jgi:hypothetical protein
MKLSNSLFLAPVFSLLACGGDGGGGVPEDPTWFGDIQGLLTTNCNGCHGVPAANGAPEYFRLDRFVAGDGFEVETAAQQDVFDMLDSVHSRAVNFDADGVGPMPPAGAMSSTQMAMLGLWIDNGAPKGSRDNQSPEVELENPTEPPASVDQELTVGFRSFDDDGDGLIVAVGYRPAGSADTPILFADNLPGGSADFSVDTGLLTHMQRFDIVTILDDGFSDTPSENKTIAVLLGDLLVDHGERGTAPTVTLASPNGGATIFGTTDIVWTATDPDPGDVLTIELDLVSVDSGGSELAVESIVSGLSNTPPFSWDTASITTEDSNGNPILYKIRVTATDTGNQNTRSDDSDGTFTIIAPGGETSLGWEADIRPLFVTYCGDCHRQPPINPNLDGFRLDKYDAADNEAPANSDDGVFEMRSLVYQRLVVAGTMPPNSQPQLGAADIAKIAEWLEAGAPFGGGGDVAPTFTWTTPNNTATTTVNNANVTLEWTANDPEGLALTGSIVMAEISATGNPSVVNCPTTLVGAVEVVGAANIEDDSFTVTLPNTGKFCFSGSVTDDAGQTSTSTAAFGVRF